MRKVLLFFFVLCMLIVTVQAQARQVAGKVTDAANEPLIGVIVGVKGTTQGVTTDVNGS